MQSLTHTRFLTKNYSNLQGLRAIPSGLCILLVSLWANTLHGRASDLTLPILESAACLVLFLLIDRYYNRVFGKVKRTYSHAELLFMALSGLLALAAFVVDSDFGLNLPFSTLGLVFAAVILGSGVWYWVQAKTLLVSNLLLGLLIAILSILPVFGVSDWWTALGIKHFLLAMTILFGVYIIIVGIIGHIYFIRSLPAMPEPNHG
jgi:hypothetical protein